MTGDLERIRRNRTVTDRVGEVARLDIRIASRQKSGWRQNAWLVPISAALLAVMITSVPPYLTFDPAKQGVPLNPAAPALNYALITAHVLFGTVALVAVCLAVWPWLRIKHQAVHRWSGRVYVFSAMPAALLTLAVKTLDRGWGGDIGAYAQGGFWFLTTLVGYIAIRQRNQARHRRWMLYSFAMAFSVVWGAALTPLMPTMATLPYLMELVRWVGWLANLLVIKWWLDRTERRAGAVVRFPAERRRSEPTYRQQAA